MSPSISLNEDQAASNVHLARLADPEAPDQDATTTGAPAKNLPETTAFLQQTLQPNLAEARRFLEVLALGESVTFQTFDDGERKSGALARVLHGTIDQRSAELSALNRRGAGVFVMVNRGDLTGRAAVNVQKVRALFVDLDGAPLEPVLQCGMPPHIVVDSSPKRWHAFWLVSDCTLQDFKSLQQALAAKFNSDPNVNDLPRVMRLPGFYHRKAEPVLTRVRSINSRPPYTVAQLTQGLALTPAAQSTNVPATAKGSPSRINWDFEVHYLYPPANADLIADNCAQLREMRDTLGNIKEPRWYACLGVLAHATNGDEIAHAWSNGHPKYKHTETEGKLDRLRANAIGPTTCAQFANLCSERCASCANRGKIASPIQLGNVHRAAPEVLPLTESPSSALVAPQSHGAGSPLTVPYIAQHAALPFGAPATVEPLFDVESARASRFFRTAPAPRTWILKDCLPAGIVGGIVASGGTGKSQAMLQLAAAVATGLPFCDTWEVGEPGEVLALMAEDDDAELHRRMQYIARELERKHPGRNTESAIGQNCVIKSLVGAGSNLLTKLYPDREVRQTDVVARVIVTARQLSNPKLIILDPASRFRGGVENSAEDVTRFIEAAECIRAAIPGVTVLLVHHTNKWSSQADEQSAGAARGSSAFSDGLRFQWNLAALNQKEAARVPTNERHLYLSATITKSNYAPPQPTVYLKRGEGGVLTKTSLNDAVGKKGGDILLQIVARVRDDARNGEPLSAEKFEKKYGGKNNVFSIGATALRGFIRQAIDDAGYLTNAPVGRERPLVVTESGRAALSVMDATGTPDARRPILDSANNTK